MGGTRDVFPVAGILKSVVRVYFAREIVMDIGKEE
jgi:hypothetical protein